MSSEFRRYWTRHCPTAGREQALKLWNFSKEVLEACTDIKKETMFNTPSQAVVAFEQYTNSLAPIPQDCCKASVPCQNKGNNPMYVDNDKHIESSKINYVADRAQIAYNAKRHAMIEVFHLDTPAIPATPELLIEAITSGNYQIKPKNERNTYDRATNQILWRSPDIKADQAGYDKALTDLAAVCMDIKDTIAVGTPADAMTKIKALDAWTPTVGNA